MKISKFVMTQEMPGAGAICGRTARMVEAVPPQAGAHFDAPSCRVK